MPKITITNLTRNRVSLPGVPPYTISNRQENGMSLVDEILAPFQSVTRNVSLDELERVQVDLTRQINAGILRISVTAHNQGVQPGLEPATNEKAAAQDDIFLPAVAGTTLSGGALSADFNTAPSAQPDVPRTVDVTFTNTWDGGDIIVTGTLVDGTSYSQLYKNPSASTTIAGTAGFVTIQNIRNTGTRTAGTVNIVTGAGLALARRNISAVIREAVSGAATAPANETIGTVDLVNGTVVPTTTPDSTKVFYFWYY